MTADTETLWDVPDPLEIIDVQLDADTTSTVRRHGNADGRRLVLSHGNGLAIDLTTPSGSTDG